MQIILIYNGMRKLRTVYLQADASQNDKNTEN